MFSNQASCEKDPLDLRSFNQSSMLCLVHICSCQLLPEVHSVNRDFIFQSCVDHMERCQLPLSRRAVHALSMTHRSVFMLKQKTLCICNLLRSAVHLQICACQRCLELCSPYQDDPKDPVMRNQSGIISKSFVLSLC
jgi:hypothetical protein